MGDGAIIDLEALRRLESWGGPDLVRQMIRLFLSNAPERLERIRTGVTESRGAEAERGAHSLKSTAGNLGVTELNRLAAAMEEKASAGDLEGVRRLLGEAEAAYERARHELELLAG